MKPITRQLLQKFPYNQQAGPDVVQRGRAYYQAGRVSEVEQVDAGTVICQVQGNTGDYEVEVRADGSKLGLHFECNCPHAEGGHFCKHMVAAALEVTDYLEADGYDDELEPEVARMPPLRPAPPTPPSKPGTQASPKWRNQLNQVLGAPPYRRAGTKTARFVGLVILERLEYYGYQYSYSGNTPSNDTYTLTPYVFSAAAWPALPAAEDPPSAAAINAQLGANRKWMGLGQVLTHKANPAEFLNLNAEAVEFLNGLQGLRNPYGGYGPGLGYLPMLLAMLAKLDLPLFLGSTRTPKIERRLQVLPEPVAVAIDLRSAAETITLEVGVERDGVFRPLQAGVTVIYRNPTWAVLGDVVAPVQGDQALNLLGAFPIQIPAAAAETFREHYLAGLAQTLPFRSGAVAWHDVQTDPVPRLYLSDDQHHHLNAEVRFAYGEHEVAALKTIPPVSIATRPGSWDLVRIHRQPEREDDYLQSLVGTAYGLKRGGYPLPYGAYALRSKVHPFDFLLHSVPRLVQAGFEVYGEEALKLGKLNRHTPTLRVAITSGLDWFDLKTVVAFGDQEISLQAVRQALQQGQRFIKLADGSAGQIPADWLEKTKHLWELATETEDGFRVSDAHLALLDPLLEADPELAVPSALRKRRDRFRNFEGITVQPLPEHFVGTLRPYQQHGLNWLHFLHDYNYGGILADDMGLGKTVQVLAFLQLLKGRARRRRAVLLVVPKSLIANWQREAANFTPGLRLLPYLGMGRSKDPVSFKGYDVVLTTYGTMLRDVDSLRKYPFSYVILDESQAIKNPLSKSARAARRLEAEHRLVMTGTPVENNSLELWSQFAFLNPGLLGSLDYFRRAFALPIESRGDEAAAATLRSLVYPFILRRTKAQVAPELPPRTERIIYADMDSAQQKLYARTRARYQAELLNLIEKRGLNDTRFKILEGLLRLRQIAIHPALVDAGYKGAAPKLDLLLETLETLQAEQHKVLIFSQFVGMLKLVRRELDARQFKYVYLDGRTTNRQARVDEFQTDPAYPFFLISLKAGGVGLNLTAADYVIHLDPWWNPAVEMQASDRAHRIGQDKPVFIYKLIARDTVEEKILQLQEKKRALVQSLVTTEAGFFKSLTPDDVRQLFG
jgi:non-specific serine/threonine protein kinase